MEVGEILQEFNIKCDRGLEYFSKVLCPFHEDNNPSGSIHNKSGVFSCFACGKKSSLITFLVRTTGLPIYQVKRKLGIKSDCRTPIPPEDIELEHIRIWESNGLISELRKRQVSDDAIRRHRLGVKQLGNENRITIPIVNDVGEYANQRLYLPGAKERKFLNLAGRERSKIRFFPIEQLEFDQILVCAGEIKAIVAAEILNKYDIGAISPTCGELSWPTELNDRFRNKLIYVCSDDDETGYKSAELRCRLLKPFAREIHKVYLPHKTFEEYGITKGDINDFVRIGGDLYQLLLDSPEWVLVPGGEVINESITEVQFRQAFHQDSVGKRVKFTGIIAGYSGNTFNVPSLVEVKCTRDQSFCMVCDVNSKTFASLGSETEMSIHKEHPAILGLIGERTLEHSNILKDCFNIPKACRVCSFYPKKQYSVTEIRIDEQLDPTSRSEPMTMRIGYVVNGPQTFDSHSYNFTGRLYPSPKNQLSTFLASDCEPTEDSLDAYISPSDVYFDLFRPSEWTVEAVKQKLDDLYDDLEANVTKIWQRRDFHLAVDLTYHSILHFDFNGVRNVNAYIELLAVGDTEQGKSQITDSMRDYYGLGFRVDCKSVTLPGLTIGMDKSVNRYFPVYGVLVRNDRGLVIFEELKGMDQKVFQKLTEVRSTGMVQVTKIAASARYGRVRLIAITNPVGERDIASYAFGIESALGIIGTNEDLRRFDIVMILGRSDIDSNLLSQQLRNPPVVPVKYDSEHCQRLILKAWKCESVTFENTQYVLDCAKRLSAVFGDGPPVLGSNSAHIKVAKLSAALAARTASYEEDTLIVRNCHVDYIEQFLMRIYTSPSSRLDVKSKAVRDSHKLRNKDELKRFLLQLSNGKSITDVIHDTDELSSSVVKEVCGDFMTGSVLFSKLLQSNALIRIRGDCYVKTVEFMELLKSLQFPDDKLPEYLRNV